MAILRKMRQQEFADYCDYFIDDYSREIVQNYGHSIDVAIELAKKSLNDSFPNGIESSDHNLLCLEENVENKLRVVGYLWHSVNRSDNSTFIYDFYIYQEYQGQGLGKQAIALLEEQLRLENIKQIKLRVAYHNERALKLYQAVGFSITGFNMAKILG